MRGTLSLPTGGLPRGGRLLALASGGGRFSPRNQYVAQVLRKAGLVTLLLDLLEEDEAADRSKVFDIALLAGRLQAAADWLASQSPESEKLRLGYFGAEYRRPGPHSGRRRRRHNPSARLSRGEADLIWRLTLCPE